MNFIFTGLQSWDIAIGSNAKNIAAQLSHNHRVLYVNPPESVTSLLRSGNRIKSGIRKVADNLFVADLPIMLLSIGGVKVDKLFDSLNRINNRKYAAAIRRAASEISMENFVHIIDNDIFRSQYLKEYLNPDIQIYYRRDLLLTVEYWRRHAPRLEPVIAAKADYVMTNSPYLANGIEQYNPRTYYVGQGVDLTAYDPQSVIPRKVDSVMSTVGYVGAITALRLDAELICDIASARPNYLFVMIGSEDEHFRNHRIHTLANVRFLGFVLPAELPAYISGFDVCINPQIVNPITVGNYPRKIDEYLALGKPVVATDTPTMRIFEAHVALCTGVQEYVEAIDRAFGVPYDVARVEFARSHSWENSVNEMLRIIER